MSSVMIRSQPSVLIVEDDDRVRALYHLAVEHLARVIEASDGTEALTILDHSVEGAVDLVLADQMLPNVCGIELARLVKQRWSRIPVIIITGFGSEDLAVEALRAGVRDYLKKPIQVSELRRVVFTHALRSGADGPRDPSSLETDAPDRAAPSHPGIRRAVAFVGEHFTEPITLSQIASEAGLSRFHFCRRFRQQVGVPFHEYVQALRINRARALLSEERLTVTEVAYAIGFNDLSHFDKVFNRMVGVSPTRYRRATPPPEQSPPNFSN